MPPYNATLSIFQTNILNDVKALIIDKFFIGFDEWIDIRGPREFSKLYHTRSMEAFGQYMTAVDEETFLAAGRHTAYALLAYVYTTNAYATHDVTNFLDVYITRQIDDLHKWCPKVRGRYEEYNLTESETSNVSDTTIESPASPYGFQNS